MARRNYDGTFRNNNKPKKVSNSIQIARWVESEVLRWKQLGLSFPAIAKRIVEVARGEQRAMTPLPPGIDFRSDYKISPKACQKAFHRALEREPTEAADKLRCLYTQRAEEMILALQPGIQKGDPRAIVATVRVLEFQAKINGILSPKVSEPTEPPNDRVSIDLIRQLVASVDDSLNDSLDDSFDDSIETVATRTQPVPAATTAGVATEDDDMDSSSTESSLDSFLSRIGRLSIED